MSEVKQEQEQVNEAVETQGEGVVDNTTTESVQPVEQTETISDWRSTLSDELKGSKSLQDYKDIESLARSHVHLQSTLGKKMKDMSPEDLEIFNSLREVPKSPDEYKLPEGADETMAGWFVREAHEQSLTQAQARHLAEKYMEIETQMRDQWDQQQKLTQDEWLKQIKQEFGSSFNDRVSEAQKAVQTYGGQELKDYLNQTGLGNHPAMVKAFAQIGKELVEDKFTAAESSRRLGLTPQEALEQISAKKSDETFMKQYKNKSDPGHSHAIAEMERLFKAAYPES